MAQGTRIPVFSTEKLRIEAGGRGLYVDDDASNFDVSAWTGASSNSIGATRKFLPASGAVAYLKVTGGTTAYYVPLFSKVM